MRIIRPTLRYIHTDCIMQQYWKRAILLALMLLYERRRIKSRYIKWREWYGETEHYYCLILCEKKSEMQALHPHDLFMSSLLKIALVQL